MAYVDPKTDWNEAYEPAPEDMNRIEGNTKQNKLDIDAEESARIADVNAEEISRIASDDSIDAKVTNTENIITELQAVL